jgi:hypothetical protein
MEELHRQSSARLSEDAGHQNRQNPLYPWTANV